MRSVHQLDNDALCLSNDHKSNDKIIDHYKHIEGASALVPPTPFYGGGQGDKQFAING